MAREYARLRERNQLTLPASVVEQMGPTRAMVEFSTNGKGGVQLHPAKIVKVSSAEANARNKMPEGHSSGPVR
jgi:hypothetical protein